MPFLPILSPALVLTCLAVFVCVTGAIAFVGSYVWFRFQESRRERIDPLGMTKRHCCYCRWGEARLVEESTKFDGEDIVDVRCFACTRCGLPYWMVNRSPVFPHITR